MAELAKRTNRSLNSQSAYSKIETMGGDPTEDWKADLRMLYGKPEGWEPEPDEWDQTATTQPSDLLAVLVTMVKRQNSVLERIAMALEGRNDIPVSVPLEHALASIAQSGGPIHEALAERQSDADAERDRPGTQPKPIQPRSTPERVGQ